MGPFALFVELASPFLDPARPAVYTGGDTKMNQNQAPAPTKVSAIDATIGRYGAHTHTHTHTRACRALPVCPCVPSRVCWYVLLV